MLVLLVKNDAQNYVDSIILQHKSLIFNTNKLLGDMIISKQFFCVYKRPNQTSFRRDRCPILHIIMVIAMKKQRTCSLRNEVFLVK